MHVLLFFINALAMIVLPLVIGTVIERRWRVNWGLFGIGAAAFVGAQLFHLPFNWMVSRSGILPQEVSATTSLLVLALFYGLSAGVFEEGARYLVFRFWARNAREWAQGLMVGAGHGGIEAMLLGLLTLANLLIILRVRSGDFTPLIPDDQYPLVEAQIRQMFALPWYDALLGGLERLFAICIQLSLSLLIMQVFVRGKLRWLGMAIGWHAFVDAVAVFGLQTWGVHTTEGIIGLLAVVGLGIIVWVRAASQVKDVAASIPPTAPIELSANDLDMSRDRLEESRYN